jgi:hypothetical protein
VSIMERGQPLDPTPPNNPTPLLERLLEAESEAAKITGLKDCDPAYCLSLADLRTIINALPRVDTFFRKLDEVASACRERVSDDDFRGGLIRDDFIRAAIASLYLSREGG